MRAKVTYGLAEDVPALELVTADYEAQRFREHWHAGYTVGVVTHNAQGFHCDGVEWTAGPGDLIALNPMQIHDGYSLGTGWSTRMIYLPEETFAHLLGVQGGEDGSVGRFARPVIRNPQLRDLFLAWHRAMDGSPGIAGNTLTQPLFQWLKGELIPPSNPGPSRNEPALRASGLTQRLGELAKREHPSLAEFNASLACSRSTSWRRTKRELGLAPKAVMSQLRLIEAKRMLARGATVIDAALECGYHDQSHFSREFAAAYGITAGQFRRVQLLRAGS